jgi:hypothetical protein
VNIEVKHTKISVNRLRRIVVLLWGLSTTLVPKTALRLGDGRKALSPYAGGNTDTQEKFREKIGISELTLGAGESGQGAGLRLHRGYGQRYGLGHASSLGRQFIEEFLGRKTISAKEQGEQRIRVEFRGV